MNDFESFQKALDEMSDESYMNSLTRSLSLVLEEFYRNLKCVGVSAATGAGMDEFFAAVSEATTEYETEYLPDLLERIRINTEKSDQEKETELHNVMADMTMNEGQEGTVPVPGPSSTAGPTTDL